MDRSGWLEIVPIPYDDAEKRRHMAEKTLLLTVKSRGGMALEIDFEDEAVATLQVDEPPPMGTGSGPDPTQLLAAAVGSCLTASAVYCFQKSRIQLEGVETRVRGTIERNPQNRLRVSRIDVEVETTFAGEVPRKRVDTCLGLFEDFCTVSESVRQGIPIHVDVKEMPHGGGSG